jgi:hypothetical protein
MERNHPLWEGSEENAGGTKCGVGDNEVSALSVHTVLPPSGLRNWPQRTPSYRP